MEVGCVCLCLCQQERPPVFTRHYVIHVHSGAALDQPILQVALISVGSVLSRFILYQAPLNVSLSPAQVPRFKCSVVPFLEGPSSSHASNEGSQWSSLSICCFIGLRRGHRWGFMSEPQLMLFNTTLIHLQVFPSFHSVPPMRTLVSSIIVLWFCLEASGLSCEQHHVLNDFSVFKCNIVCVQQFVSFTVLWVMSFIEKRNLFSGWIMSFWDEIFWNRMQGFYGNELVQIHLFSVRSWGQKERKHGQQEI